MIRELSSKLKDKLNESDMIVVKFLRAQKRMQENGLATRMWKVH